MVALELALQVVQLLQLVDVLQVNTGILRPVVVLDTALQIQPHHPLLPALLVLRVNIGMEHHA